MSYTKITYNFFQKYYKFSKNHFLLLILLKQLDIQFQNFRRASRGVLLVSENLWRVLFCEICALFLLRFCRVKSKKCLKRPAKTLFSNFFSIFCRTLTQKGNLLNLANPAQMGLIFNFRGSKMTLKLTKSSVF